MKRPFCLLALLLLGAGFASGDPGSPQDQEERATTALLQAVKSDPNNAELWTHLGFAYRKTGQLDQAVDAFNKAATLNPRSTDALYMLGIIYESRHQTQDALRAWKAYVAIETDPTKKSTAENHIQHLSR